MSKVNTAVEDNIFLRYLVIITGMLIACIGINGFIRPAHLLSGGVPGISTAINYLTGINIGILTFLINIPIFILGFIYLEKSFCISSLINMILFSILLGVFKEFLITIIVIFPYRAFSGGFHLKTHLGCILGTSMFYCGIAYISKLSLFSYNTKYILTILIWIFGILMCRLYAPADTENVPILRKKERKTKRILSYIVLTITLIIGAVIKNNTISNIIILGMLVQSIMISKLAYRITNNKYGYEVYN